MFLNKFGPWTTVAALGWLPLLILAQASAFQPGQLSPTLELCRVDVSPCQREVNLAPGEEVTLALFVRIPESASGRPGRSIVGWHVRLKVVGSDVVEFPGAETTGLPFREQAGPASALAGMNPINAGPPGDRAGGNYYRIKNSYSAGERSLEYAVTIVGGKAGQSAQPQLRLKSGEKTLLGTLALRGRRAGIARLVADSTEPTASKLVMLNSAGELSVIELANREPLAQVNVGPAAEKVRLEGQIWSDVPTGEDSRQPFSKPFSMEVWEKDAVPKWQGGPDEPLATFNHVRPDDNGQFAIKDLPAELIPVGTYDLRVAADGALSYLFRDVRIEPSVSQSSGSTQVIIVSVGPIPSGDLNGDNLVNDSDVSQLASNFGRQIGETEDGSTADFNDDGVVDGQDFSLLAANYGRRGE